MLWLPKSLQSSIIDKMYRYSRKNNVHPSFRFLYRLSIRRNTVWLNYKYCGTTSILYQFLKKILLNIGLSYKEILNKTILKHSAMLKLKKKR